jgi:multidrug efflux pump subunit AcrA (membrane-fusion protein)
MFARLRLGNAAKQKVITVPAPAILTEGAHSFVLIEEAPGRFRRRQVKSGADVGGMTVVEEGLGPADRVVTSGVLLVSNAEGAGQ